MLVDYIGCMIPNGKPNPNMNSNTLLTLAAQQVRALGMKYGFPVVSASQTNRGGYGIKTIPISQEDHTKRLDFPASWAGLVDQELEILMSEAKDSVNEVPKVFTKK